MEKINSYKELSGKIFKYLKKGIITNFFASQESVEEAIFQEILYVVENDNFLIICKDRGEFYITYFYFLEDEESFVSALKNLDKKCVIEVAYRTQDIKTKLFLNMLKSNDFSILTQRIRYKNDNEIIGNDFSVLLATEQDVEDIEEIFNDNFNKYSGCIPNTYEIKKAIDEERVICLSQDKILGFLIFSENDKSADIKHLAVRKECQGKGLAKLLIMEMLAKVLFKKIYVWTGKDNIPAQKVYESTGFVKDEEYESLVLFWDK